MNIDSIKNYYPTGNSLKHKPIYGLESKQRGMSADLYTDKKLNRGYYSGSFTGLNGAAANVSKGLFDKILDLCDSHTVIAQNLVALVLAAGFRPIAIMSLPGKKNKKDKQYASGHSIASGLIGFGFSSIVMYPLGKASKKVLQNAKSLIADSEHFLSDKAKEIYNVDNLKDIEKSKSFKKVTRFLDMAPDVFIFGIAKAMLTVALIPPILKYGFGLEKDGKTKVKTSDKAENNIQAKASANDKPKEIVNVVPPTMEKPEITKFAGGLK